MPMLSALESAQTHAPIFALLDKGLAREQLFSFISHYGLQWVLDVTSILNGKMDNLTLEQVSVWLFQAFAAMEEGKDLPPIPSPH